MPGGAGQHVTVEPHCLLDLCTVRTLVLSNNQLNGTIPTTIGALTSLTYVQVRIIPTAAEYSLTHSLLCL